MNSPKRTIWLMALILIPALLRSQDTVQLFRSPAWDSAYNMEEYASYVVDEHGEFTVEQVSQATFTKDSNFLQTIHGRYGKRPITAWSRWLIHNPSDQPESVLLLFNRMSFLTLWYEDQDGLHLIRDNADFFTPLNKNQRRGFEFPAAPGATVRVYVRMKNAYRNFAREYPVIIRPAEFKDVLARVLYGQRYFVYVDVLFLSIIFFITLHTLAQYFFNRRREFLLYAFYSGAVFIFFLFKFDEAFYNDLLFSYLPYIHKFGNNPMSYLMFFAYYCFVRTFIDFKAIAPWFYQVIRFTEKLLLAVIVADVVLSQLNQYPAKILIFNIIRSYLVLMAFTGITILFRTGKPLPRFIAVGSGCFVLGALAAMVLSWIQQGPYVHRFDPIIFMQLGMVLELLCFTLGLSYKTGLIEKEKISTQEQLIGQLEANKQLQDELNTQLETRVEEQTSRILAQQQQLEKEKEQQLTLEFTKKITEMELQLLKSQLNPHFYFNTLHNLYGLAMIAPKKAPDAILKLSDIMEYVIYDCRHDKVPLAKELKFINSYIELEKLRYDDSAMINLRVEGDPDGKFISPLLLIQFIENAFKHGLEHSKNDSYLSISITIEHSKLHYTSSNSIKGEISISGGVGLANVKKRLEIIYPGKHQLDIESDGDQYEVRLALQLN